MNKVIVKVSDDSTHKYSTNHHGRNRLRQEVEAFTFLQGSRHIASLLEAKVSDSQVSIYMQTLKGETLRALLGMKDEYKTQALSWDKVKKLLAQYIQAEVDFLDRGALYRDMNFDHMMFMGDHVVFLDLESTIIQKDISGWVFSDMRGTWETMAPEEFIGYGRLSERTTTYRVAIIAHVMLTGRLPFRRFSYSRAATHTWRAKHPAEISDGLSRATRRVFSAALGRKETHRHKDPSSFFAKLIQSFEGV